MRASLFICAGTGMLALLLAAVPGPPLKTSPTNITLGPSAEEHTRFANATVKEGVAAFQEIQRQVLAGEYDALRVRVLDNGEPLKPRANWTEYNEDFPRTQPTLRDGSVQAAIGRSPVARIERQIVYQFGADGKTVTTGEVIILTWPLPGTEAIGKASFPNIGRGPTTVTSDGTLWILMKKINGQWYWNPFGW